MVEDVEELCVIAQDQLFGEFKVLEDTEVKTRLEWAAKRIAPGAGKARLRKIARSTAVRGRPTRRHTIGAWSIGDDSESSAVEHRVAGIYARGALKLHALGRPAWYPE